MAAGTTAKGQVRHLDHHKWGAIARQCRQYSFRQSPAYALELAKLRRASCEFLVIDEVDPSPQVVAVVSVRVRSTFIPGAGLAYVSAGPLLTGGLEGSDAPRILRLCLETLSTEYVQQRQLCLRVALPVLGPRQDRWINETFTDCGFEACRSARVYRTLLTDLSRPEHDIRAALDGRWRNHLTAALRRGVPVEVTRAADAVARFAPMLDDTIRRKGFSTDLGASFYDQVQRTADIPDRMVVAIANDGIRDVAGVVASLLGDTAVYVLGATTEHGMKSKAAYACQWQVLQAAREAGCRWYDLGGIDPINNPGVYHFKAGFGEHDVVAFGPFERRPTGVPGMMSKLVEDSYTFLRRSAWSR